MKSSSILKKAESAIEFYSENNLQLEENKEENIEKAEEKTKQKSVVIKKSPDQKYILSFNKNPNLKIISKVNSQKELVTINENPHENKNNINSIQTNVQQKPQIVENNQTEEKLSSKNKYFSY